MPSKFSYMRATVYHDQLQPSFRRQFLGHRVATLNEHFPGPSAQCDLPMTATPGIRESLRPPTLVASFAIAWHDHESKCIILPTIISLRRWGVQRPEIYRN